MLKFKVDENLPVEVAGLLNAAGYDALTVSRQRLNGARDPVVASVCQQETRAIVTLDLDFSDIRMYPPKDYSGLMVLRLPRLDKRRLLRAVSRAIPLLAVEPLVGKLWIVDEVSVRIRG